MDPVTTAGTTPSILAGQTAPTATDNTSTSAPVQGTVNEAESGSGPQSLEINWFDGLPAGLKAEKTLESFKGKPISAVVESYVQAQKSFGSRLPVPLPTDKPEERAAKIQRLQQELGRPATPADYKFDLPAYEQLGLQANEAQLTAFKEAAHKMGLTNDQVREIVAWQAQQEAASQPDRHAAASCLPMRVICRPPQLPTPSTGTRGRGLRRSGAPATVRNQTRTHTQTGDQHD